MNWKNIRIGAILILAMFVFHQLISGNYWFFDNLIKKTYAEEQLAKQNIVLVLVEKDIYFNLNEELARYGVDYIQASNPNTIALILPIDKKEQSINILKLIQNIYFEGIEKAPSALKGIVLVGDVPLPVINDEGVVFPSIWPYVDLKNVDYVFDSGSKFFVPTKIGDQKAEIWHGRILMDNIQQYKRYFEKLKNYRSSTNFTTDKIRYDNFLLDVEAFNPQTFKLYLLGKIFSQDRAYHRYSDKLLTLLQSVISKDTSQKLQNVSFDIDEQISKEQDIGKSADEYMREYFKISNEALLKIKNYADTTLSQLQKYISQTYQINIPTYQEFLFAEKNYFKAFNESFGSSRNDNLVRDIEALGYDDFGKIDSFSKFMDINWSKVINLYNRDVESVIKKQVYKYALKDLVPRGYIHREGKSLKCVYDTDKDIEKTSSNLALYQEYSGFYFGLPVRDIFAPTNFYFGDFMSGDILKRDYKFEGESPEALKPFLFQQVEANRGYNFINLEKDQKEAEKAIENNCLSKRMLTAWGGATPLNLDDKQNLKQFLPNLMFSSIFDRGGMKTVTQEYLSDFRGFKNYVYLNFVRSRPYGKFVFNYPPCSRSTSNPYKLSREVDFFEEAVKNYFKDTKSEDSSTRINIFSGDKLIASRWTGAIVSYGCSDIKGIIKYSDKYNQYDYKIYPTVIFHTHPTENDISQINPVTFDRGIDNKRGVSFKGVGGDFLRWDFPNFLEVKIFSGDDNSYKLKTSKEIELSIKEYLRKKIKDYNSDLQQQLQKKDYYRRMYKTGFDMLSIIDPQLAPFEYKLLPEDLLITTLGEEKIKQIAYILRLQNYGWKFINFSGSNVEDFLDDLISQYSVENALEGIVQTYLYSDVDASIPGYQTGGYQVGIWVGEPSSRGERSDFEKDKDYVYLQKQQKNNEARDLSQYDDSEEVLSLITSSNSIIDDICGIPPNGKVSIWEWMGKISCRFDQISSISKENVIKITPNQCKIKAGEGASNFYTNFTSLANLGIEELNVDSIVLDQKGQISITTIAPVVLTITSSGGCVEIQQINSCDQAIELTLNGQVKIPFVVTSSLGGNFTLQLHLCKNADECVDIDKEVITSMQPSSIILDVVPDPVPPGGQAQVFVKILDKGGNQIKYLFHPIKLQTSLGELTSWLGQKGSHIEIYDVEKPIVLDFSRLGGKITKEKVELQASYGDLIAKKNLEIDEIIARLYDFEMISGNYKGLGVQLWEGTVYLKHKNKPYSYFVKIFSQDGKIIPGYLSGDNFIPQNMFAISSNGEKIAFIRIPHEEKEKIIIGIGAQKEILKEFPPLVLKPFKVLINGLSQIQDKEIFDVKVVDRRGNRVKEKVSLKVIGSSNLSFPHSIIAVDGIAKLPVIPLGKGKAWIGVKIGGDQNTAPDIKQIKIVEKEFVDFGRLNVAYFNRFGVGGGNIWGYLDKKYSTPKEFLGKSSKGIALTTMLIAPQNLKKSVAIISDENILSDQEIILQVKDIPSLLGEGWEIPIEIKEFSIQLGSIGRAMGLVQQGSEILEGNKKILAYKNGDLAFAKGVKLKIKNNKGIIIYGGREVGTFKIRLKNVLQNQPIFLRSKLRGVLGWAEGSTNGKKGRILVDETSSYQKPYLKGVEGVSKESLFPVGFRDGFKNISYFLGGNRVGDSTMPFQTPFLINFGDPLFGSTFQKAFAGETRYSKNLGQNIFFDRENIISADVGDFNNDGLEDIFVFKANGEIRLLKNYGGRGKQALEELGNIIKIPLPIKKGWVGNVDGDGYEDIIIQTKEGDLFVFLNHKGVIDIDPYPLCFGENKKDIFQLFVDDFDGDGYEDFLINSKVNGIRIFYGKNTKPYVSKDHKECRVDKNLFEVNTLKKREVILDNSPKRDLSIVRWKGLKSSSKDTAKQVEKVINKGIDEAKNLYDPINKLGWPWKFILPPVMIPSLYSRYIDQASALPTQFTGTIPDVAAISSGYSNDMLKYQLLPSQFGFDNDGTQGDEVPFAIIAHLTGSDPVNIVKYFEGPKQLKVGDKVKVHIVFEGAPQTIIYYEKLLGPWEVFSRDGKLDVVFSGDVKGNILMGNSFVPEGFLFGFSGQVGNGEIIYSVVYKGGIGYKVEVERVNKDINGEIRNTLPNLVFLPTDGCQKKYEYWTNQNNLGGNARDYKKQLIDVYKYELQKKQEQQEKLKQIQQSLSLDKINSLLPPETLSCDYDVANAEQIIKQDLISFGENLIKGKCGGGSSCGLPVPFNMAFFSPGMYNIWGLPIAFDPGLTVTPWTFPWFRLYLSPTLTMNLGIAACFGPYMVDVPPPFGVVAGKCLVTAIDLPCDGEENQNCLVENTSKTSSNSGFFPYQAWGDMLECQNPLPGIDTALLSPLIVNQGSEISYVGDYTQVTIKEEMNISVGVDGIVDIEGVQLQPGYDVGTSIQDGLIVGLVESLVKNWLDKQIEYIINNFTHFSIYVVLPKLDDLGKGFSSLDISQISKAFNYSSSPGNTPVKEAFKFSQSITPNPFVEIQNMFENVPLIDIKIKNIVIQYPDISNSGFSYFEAQLNGWKERNKLRLGQRKKLLSDIENLPSTGISDAQMNLNKQREKLIKEIVQKLEKNQRIVEYNLEMIKAYQRLPSKLYEYKHIIDQGVDAVLCVLEDFLASINQWLGDNANRFEAWVDAIVMGLNAIDTFQVIIDFTVNWKSKCGKCRVDNYDFHSFITSLLAIDLPIIPIPPFKLPDIYIDFSKIKLGATLTLPNLKFKPYKLDLPELPIIPPPPATYLSINPNFRVDIPLMQKLPPPPDLPEISVDLPKVELNLPVLPPAPEVPDLMPSLKAVVDIMDILGNVVFCLIKGGIGLVAEWSVKSRIEQLTQRKQRLFPFDYLRVRIPQPPLKGKDLLLETQIGLEISLTPLYNQLKGFADYRNSQLDSSLKQFKIQIEGVTNQINKTQINDINVNLKPQLNLPTPTQSYNFISPQEALRQVDIWLNTIDVAYKKANSAQKRKLAKIKNRLILLKNLQIKPNVNQLNQIGVELKNYLNYYRNLQIQRIQKIQKPNSTISLTDAADIGDVSFKTALFKVNLAPSIAFAQQQSISSPPSVLQGEEVSLDGALWDRGDDEKYYNVMGDTKLARDIYEKRHYIKKDVNQDGILDILRWDKNTINIKFGQNNDFVGSNILKIDKLIYIAPPNWKDKLSQGVLELNGKRFVLDKKLGTVRLKTISQNYDNVKRKWYNLSGVDGYGIALRLRVDDFVDKGYWTKKYRLDTKKFNISQKEGTGNDMIFADLNSPWVSIALGEKVLPQRKWRYGKIDYRDSVGTYLDVGGRSLIGDKTPPTIIAEISRKSISEKRIGTIFRGLINTHYLLDIKATDNVKVSHVVLLNESGTVISQSSGTDLQVDLFSVNPIKKTFLVLARDWKGNLAKEKIEIYLDTPVLDINSSLKDKDILNLQALLSQDVDEGIVKFQVCTQLDKENCIWRDIKEVPIDQLYLYPKKDEVVGSIGFDGWVKIIAEDGKQIAMLNIKTLEVKKLLPEVQVVVSFKNGRAQLQIQYQNNVVYEIPLMGRELQQVKLINPLYMIRELPDGYCILQGMDNQCRALLSYSGSLFVSEPYNNLWQGSYERNNNEIGVKVKDEQSRDIIIYKFNPGILIGE